MKVTLIDFEEEVMRFLKEIVSTMPTTGHKFAAGAMLASSALKMEKALATFADADGSIDTDHLRSLIEGGVASSGGEKVTFTVGSEGLAWLLKPVNISVTAEDMRGVIERVESRARMR